MSTLHEQLHAFAAHLRDPSVHPAPPGIEDRRLAVYRELVANNLRSLLAGNFPVIRATLGDARWQALVRGFQSRHRSATPLFTRIGFEFVEYLQQRAGDGGDDDAADLPWLAELAHYEWAELALQIATGAPSARDSGADTEANARQALLQARPALSPLAWPLAYRWAVHRIGPGREPDAPPATPTLLLLRRDASGDVRFSELSPLVYRLLQLLENDTCPSGHALLERLADEAQAPDRDAFLREGTAMLLRLRDEGTIVAA